MYFIMLSLAISLVIVIFALQNSAMVPIVFFNWSSEVPLVVVIFASVFAGAAIIFFLALWKEVKRKFNTVSSKATEYKGIMTSKKDAITERLEKRKTSRENKETLEQFDLTELKKDSEVPQTEAVSDPILKDE